MSRVIKYKYLILVFIFISITTILFSYDERIEDGIDDGIDNDVSTDTNDSQGFTPGTEDNDKVEQDFDDNEGNGENTDTENEDKELNTDENDEKIKEETNDKEKIEEKDTKEQIVKDPRTYYINIDAEYYHKMEYNIGLENKIYKDKIPQEELIDGSYLLFSFYKVIRNDNAKLKKIEKYGPYYSLKEFQDYIYEDDNLTEIITYNNMANVIEEEIREYDNQNNLIYRMVDDKDSKINNEYIYEYDEYGNEIIRIQRRFDEVFQIRYSFYNSSNQLIRREYYSFGTLEKTILYDYTYGFIYQKKVYNNRGNYVRTYKFRESDKADSIIRNELPGFIDY